MGKKFDFHEDYFESIAGHPHFEKRMKYFRFKQSRKFLPTAMEDEDFKNWGTLGTSSKALWINLIRHNAERLFFLPGSVRMSQ